MANQPASSEGHAGEGAWKGWAQATQPKGHGSPAAGSVCTELSSPVSPGRATAAAPLETLLAGRLQLAGMKQLW